VAVQSRERLFGNGDITISMSTGRKKLIEKQRYIQRNHVTRECQLPQPDEWVSDLPCPLSA
jgi:hypothetical protein